MQNLKQHSWCIWFVCLFHFHCTIPFHDSKRMDISWLQMSYGSNGVRSLIYPAALPDCPRLSWHELWKATGWWKYSWLWTQIRLHLNLASPLTIHINKKFMFYVPLCSKPQSTALYKKNTPGQILYSSWSSVLSSLNICGRQSLSHSAYYGKDNLW